MLPFAEEVANYAAKLSKPIARLYVTHFHSDHIGAQVFNMPVTALAEVKAKIEAVGDRVAAEEHGKHGERVAKTAVKPSIVVAAGRETVGDIPIHFIRMQNAETADGATTAFPGRGVLVAQDFIYNRVHVFLGERSFDTWAARCSAITSSTPQNTARSCSQATANRQASNSTAKCSPTFPSPSAFCRTSATPPFSNRAGERLPQLRRPRPARPRIPRLLFPPKTANA